MTEIKKSIYVYGNPKSYKIKIGMSGNPKKRIIKFSKGIKKADRFLFYTEQVFLPEKIEKRIHNLLSKHSIGNEWFNYSFKKAKWIIKNMVASYKTVPLKKTTIKEVFNAINKKILIKNLIVLKGYDELELRSALRRRKISEQLAKDMERFTTIASQFWLMPNKYNTSGKTIKKIRKHIPTNNELYNMNGERK